MDLFRFLNLHGRASVIFVVSASLAVFFPLNKSCAEILSLEQLLERAESNVFLQAETQALQLEAQLKRSQVTTERWLNTFELEAFTGVVPDTNVEESIRTQNSQDFLFNFNASDFENDFALNNLGPFVRLNLKAVQPLYTWGKIRGFDQMAERNMELTEFEKERLKAEVRFLVKRAYYTLQLSSESIAVLEEVKKKLQEAEEKVEELLIKNAENVEENDRLKIRVFMADVENRSLDAFRGVRVSQAALQELASLQSEFQLSQTSLSPEIVRDVSKSGVVDTALAKKPEIQKLDKAIEIKKAERTTVKADLFPSFFLAGQVDYAVAPGRTDVKNPYLSDEFNKLNMGVALGLKQDLGIYRTLNKMKQSDAQIQNLEAKKARLSSLARVQVEDAFEKAVSAQAGIQINEEAFRAARSWLTSTGLAFSLGTAPTKDVLESYAAYFKARVDLLRSIYDLNMALSELSLASGAEIVERLK